MRIFDKIAKNVVVKLANSVWHIGRERACVAVGIVPTSYFFYLKYVNIGVRGPK